MTYTLKFLGCLTLTLSSCVGTSIREKIAKAVTVPKKWQHRSSSEKPLDTTALPTWWEHFHDPVLNRLIGDALKSSPTVNSAIARVDEYRARRGLEVAGMFPSLDTTQSGRTSRTKDRIANQTSIAQSYGASLDASWQVDLFGKQSQTVKAASADLAQVHENYYGAQVTLAADVATAYVTLRSAESQIEVVKHSLETRSETVKLTEWLEEVGTGDALDTQRSIATLEQARASLPTLQLTVTQTIHQLALLSGRTPEALDSQLKATRPVPSISASLAIGIPAETLRQRPDVRAAERGVEAAFARTESARRERLPALSLSGSIGVEALKAGRIFSPESAVGSLIGNLVTPIIDSGRIKQNILILTSKERQSLLAYQATVLTALAEVEDAQAAVQRYSEQLDILAKASSVAREAVKLSAQQYEAGQVDLLISLNAQRTLLSLEQQMVTTTAQRASASIQLYKALGGGWSNH